VLYRRIWSIVGNSSILCCDNCVQQTDPNSIKRKSSSRYDPLIGKYDVMSFWTRRGWCFDFDMMLVNYDPMRAVTAIEDLHIKPDHCVHVQRLSSPESQHHGSMPWKRDDGGEMPQCGIFWKTYGGDILVSAVQENRIYNIPLWLQ
jgi:hypothetical protein